MLNSKNKKARDKLFHSLLKGKNCCKFFVKDYGMINAKIKQIDLTENSELVHVQILDNLKKLISYNEESILNDEQIELKEKFVPYKEDWIDLLLIEYYFNENN